MAAYLQHPHAELASRLATLVNARRQSLQTLGLERLEREVTSLAQYIESRRTNGSDADRAER